MVSSPLLNKEIISSFSLNEVIVSSSLLGGERISSFSLNEIMVSPSSLGGERVRKTALNNSILLFVVTVLIICVLMNRVKKKSRMAVLNKLIYPLVKTA